MDGTDALVDEALVDVSTGSSTQPAAVTSAPLGSSNNSSKSNDDKTKRLLSLARSKLEENQKILAEKDLYISQLVAALEEEKLQHTRLKRTTTKDNDDNNNTTPRNILRRVDVDDIIWILIEYDGGISEDGWQCFNSEQDLVDFVSRIPGAPLTIPPRSLSSAESLQIENEAKSIVDKVVEDFRRYKVKMEIALKQKDVDVKKASNIRSTEITSNNSDNSEEYIDELQRLKAQLAAQEVKWKTAYEKVTKENELLRSRGSDTMVATQWRERYESCIKDRDELTEKLRIFTSSSSSNSSSSDKLSAPSPNGNVDENKSLAQSYIELRDEYKEFRRKVLAIEKQRSQEGTKKSDNSVTTYDNTSTNTMKLGMGESKIQYIRQMVFQYLSCRDSVVKPHIESALIAIFRFNSDEKNAIESRQKEEEGQDPLTSITQFLGNLGV